MSGSKTKPFLLSPNQVATTFSFLSLSEEKNGVASVAQSLFEGEETRARRGACKPRFHFAFLLSRQRNREKEPGQIYPEGKWKSGRPETEERNAKIHEWDFFPTPH